MHKRPHPSNNTTTKPKSNSETETIVPPSQNEAAASEKKTKTLKMRAPKTRKDVRDETLRDTADDDERIKNLAELRLTVVKNRENKSIDMDPTFDDESKELGAASELCVWKDDLTVCYVGLGCDSIVKVVVANFERDGGGDRREPVWAAPSPDGKWVLCVRAPEPCFQRRYYSLYNVASCLRVIRANREVFAARLALGGPCHKLAVCNFLAPSFAGHVSAVTRFAWTPTGLCLMPRICDASRTSVCGKQRHQALGCAIRNGNDNVVKRLQHFSPEHIPFAAKIAVRQFFTTARFTVSNMSAHFPTVLVSLVCTYMDRLNTLHYITLPWTRLLSKCPKCQCVYARTEMKRQCEVCARLLCANEYEDDLADACIFCAFTIEAEETEKYEAANGQHNDTDDDVHPAPLVRARAKERVRVRERAALALYRIVAS
jgi:hypothetical protein